MAVHQGDNPSGILVTPLRIRNGEVFPEAALLRRSRTLEQMDQHQRALAFDDVAGEVLPVNRPVPGNVQDVILNLERGAQKVPELDEPIRREGLLAANQRTRTAWKNRG